MKRRPPTKSRRYILYSDTHCGSPYGLHHPDDQCLLEDHPDADRVVKLQREQWRWFAREVESEKPFDAAIFLGDGTDGTQSKQGGLGLMHNSQEIQSRCFSKIARSLDCPEHWIAAGTDYHTGAAESWESVAATELRAGGYEAHYANKLRLSLNGITMIGRHWISGGSVYAGRGTALLRELASNVLEAALGQEHRADLLVWAHRHAYVQIQTALGLALVLPALASRGGKHGETKCSGPTDFGFVVVDIHDADAWRINPTCRKHIAKLAHQLPPLVAL